MTFKDSPSTENKYFDQRSCGKVLRIGAVACAAVLAGGVVSLVLVDPSHSHCAGWENDGGSIWGLVGGVGLWAAWIGFLAIKWDWVARRTVERIERDERLAEAGTGAGWKWALTNFRIGRARARVFYTHMIDFRGLLIVVMAGSVFFCALPLLIVTLTCF